jgi:hypothetical protein
VIPIIRGWYSSFLTFQSWDHEAPTVSFGLRQKKHDLQLQKSSAMIKETSRNLQRKGNNCIRGGVLFKTQMNNTMLINSYVVS